MTLTEFYRHDAYSTYSLIPVYIEENDDFIKGYVLRQTILEKLSEDKFELRLTDIVRPVLTFQENEPVSKIWEKLLAKKEHISVIIDEYGCFRGIVTMEDVIETMLGTEIVDEKDTVTDMQELAGAARGAAGLRRRCVMTATQFVAIGFGLGHVIRNAPRVLTSASCIHSDAH